MPEISVDIVCADGRPAGVSSDLVGDAAQWPAHTTLPPSKSADTLRSLREIIAKRD